ncbi:NAD(P)H-hydrate dehydratase [candidate division WOR-3 bacterium]|nr:NAD(P)H-hydrate dehydratase [candidate division WOR-3 bacterium]
MRVTRRDEMRIIDKRAVQEFGIPSIILMENAGRGVAETIQDYFESRLDALSVLCVCGKGNNGGDGFVTARHLANAGAEVEILLLAKIEELAGDALTNAKIAQQCGLAIQEVTNSRGLKSWWTKRDYDVVVDAVLGTGFKGLPQGLANEAIRMINQAAAYVVSIDIPSGIETDGMDAEPGSAVKANLTVTMAYLKPCHLLYPTRLYCGDVWVADIGIPNSVIDKEGSLRLMTQNEAVTLLPERIAWGNKASFGKVLIVAGSRGMSGAARLAAMGAARVGAGLVYLGFPQTMADVFDAGLLETVKRPFRDTGDGHLASEAADEVLKMEADVKLLAIGPGLGTHPETVEMVRRLSAEWKKPMVIDADALNALAQKPEMLEGKKPPLALTPHPGEMARLTGMDAKTIDRHRLDVAEEYAKKWGLVLVLKGAPTITACPGETWINSTGNSGLASGGTGDVLTGVIAGLAAQGLPLSHAASLGVWLHGRAGDLAADSLGEHSVLAGDLIYRLADAIVTSFERDEEDE